jgi:sortase A
MKPLEVIPDEVPTLSRDEAMYDLRSKLVGQIQSSAKKVRKSRHFVPLAAALCVVFLFLFLQYNRVLFANVQAYISPGSIDPANIIIDPSTDIAVSPDPKLIIPKINVDVPVNYDAKPDYDSQMKAMETGVAYFGIPGANSRPGQIGNTVISGHSSNDVIDQGDYKFIFARLDHLENGDTIFVNYEGKRYSYTVTRKEVVKPTQVDKLVYATDKPILTLITCTPLGTSLNRLLVTAEQVSPSPSSATAAPATTGSTGSTSIPGNSPTFVQRIFGGGDN